MSKNITLSDIAAKTGVSIVTVSKALSGQKGVSDATRAQISRAAQEMGYLRKRSEDRKTRLNYTIGVVTAARYYTDRLSMYWTIYRDLSTRLAGKGCFCLLEMVSREEEENLTVPGLLGKQRLDGVLVLGSFDKSYVRRLEEETDLPLVFMDTLSLSGKNDSVISNNYLGSQQMVEELIKLGHRRIGFVGTLLSTNSIDDRYLGGQKALMEQGLEYDPVWQINDRDPETGLLYESSDYVLPKGELPTAFFCSSDRSAELFLSRLEEMGLRCPEDVSIAGFDNYEEESGMEPFFSTYDINLNGMIRRSVHILLRRIENPEYRSGITLIQGRSILRKSTKRSEA